MAEQQSSNNPERSMSKSPQSAQQQTPAPRSVEPYRSREALGRSTSPFSLMQRFMNDMDRWFGDFGTSSILPRFDDSWGKQLWAPQIDVFERDKQLVVHADLPGLREQDVRVNVDEGVLTISGQRTTDERTQGQDNVYHRERSFGSFQRSIALPNGTDSSQIRASFENGVLEVTVPLPDQALPKGRDIPIGPKAQPGGAKH